MNLVAHTMRRMAKDSKRSVHLVAVHESGSWRAECAGEVALSFVGPEAALEELDGMLGAKNLCKRQTDIMPAVGGESDE